ncbi:MAG: Arc family DNA-binding protein [Sedimenticola sp.]
MYFDDRHQTRAFPLRMKEDVRGPIEASATRNNRSLNAEIIHRLEQSITSEVRAKAFNGGDPLDNMAAVVDGLDAGLKAMKAYLTQAGIESGKIKVKDDQSKSD